MKIVLKITDLKSELVLFLVSKCPRRTNNIAQVFLNKEDCIDKLILYRYLLCRLAGTHCLVTGDDDGEDDNKTLQDA